MNIYFFQLLFLITNGCLFGQMDKSGVYSLDTIFHQKRVSKTVILDTTDWAIKSSKNGFTFFQNKHLNLTLGVFFVDKKQEINGIKIKNNNSVENYVEVYSTQYISQLNHDTTTTHNRFELDIDGRIIKVYQELLNQNFIITTTFINHYKQSFCMVFTGGKEDRTSILKMIDNIIINVSPLSTDIKDDWTRW